MQISTNLRRIALFLLSMVLSAGIVFAQEKTITGKVTAEGEGPLPGVNVTVQGTVIGAMTDLNGSYTIKVPSPAAVLVFSSIGYTTKSVTVGTQNAIDMVLVSDVRALQEVVVTGYTSQRRKDLTGAVGTVEAAKLTAVPTGNVTNALQGRTSGVTVTGSGQPGSMTQVRIRGFSSFENNNPLYIVDGVPTQDISSLNPADIENISVLKDAGSASIYGSRASNGVIIVTTKKGSKGTKVTYNMYYGVQDPGKGPDNLLNAQGYADLRWLVYDNDNTPVTDSKGNPVIDPVYGNIAAASPSFPNWAGDTDWYDAITDNAPIMNHDISLSGGTDNAKFFAAIGAFTQDGIVLYTHSDRYTGRFNSEFTFLKDRIKVGENLTLAYTNFNTVTNLGEGSPIQMASYRSQPIIPVVMEVAVPDALTSHDFVPGDWGGTGLAPNLGQSSNVVADRTRAKDNINWNVRAIGSAFIDVMIVQGVHFKSTLGGTFNNYYFSNYQYKTYERSENVNGNSLNEGSGYGNDWVWTNQVTLDKTFGQHKILAIAGYESVKYDMGRGTSGTKSGYFVDDPLYRTLTNGSTTTGLSSYLNTPTTLLSQFARADYAYMDRYMLSATIRRDGSSRFGEDNRYGIFPSFSAGWRISDEEFFKGISFINDMKIRGSYGTMGNQLAVSPVNQFYNYGGEPSTSYYAITGSTSSSVQGFRPTRIGNPDAKWETSINTNIGFEANILQNKIGIKFDWYSKVTKDLLYPVELPGVAGAASVPYVNVAGMSNKGFDIELSYKQKFGELGLDVSGNITTVKNNIDEIAEGIDFFYSGSSRIGSFVRNEVGHPMSSFYGYQVDRLFQEADFHHELDDAGHDILVTNDDIATQDGAAPGFLKFQDTNGDGSITSTDRTYIGDPNPKFTYGLNLALNYRNFDLTAFFYGEQGKDIFNFNTWWTDFWPSFQGQKSSDLLNNSWTPSNTGASVPKASAVSNFSTNTQSASYYVEDGSFVRLKNLTLGYTIPESVISKANIKSLRVYVQAVNLFTITKYSGLDPEIQGSDGNGNTGSDVNRGVDYGNYPLVKQFLFGLNVNF